MGTVKIAVTIEERLLRALDRQVETGTYASRSQAVRVAVARLLEHETESQRLLAELAKLDPPEERALADEALSGEPLWPTS